VTSDQQAAVDELVQRASGLFEAVILCGESCRRPAGPTGVDGGVTKARTRKHVVSIGPGLVVAGSAVFDGGDPAASVRSMNKVLRAATSGTSGYARPNQLT
jgi:hypothetical protein